LAEADDGNETQEGESESLGSLFNRLIGDARALARAELDLYRSIVVRRLTGSRRVLLLAGSALVLMLASVTALLVGFVMALARLIGPFCAALVVGIGGVVVGLLLLWLAVRSFQRLGDMPDEEAL
jgi:hypothetical protein